jgi:hypothetical protein
MKSAHRLYLLAVMLTTVAACGHTPQDDGALKDAEASSAASSPISGYFDEIGKGLVWCFEQQAGSLPEQFDETGTCAGHGSIYEHQSGHDSVKATLESFTPVGNAGVGVYDGMVNFIYQDSACEIAFKVDYSGEDALVHITRSSCAN